MDELE